MTTPTRFTAEDYERKADDYRRMRKPETAAMLRQAAEQARTLEQIREIIHRAFLEGWRVGYYNEGDPLNLRLDQAWQDFQPELLKLLDGESGR